MALLPKVKLKVVPTFPANVIGGTGLTTTKANGSLTVDYAWQEFGTIDAIPTQPTAMILTYDTAQNSYVMVPSHLLGGAVAGIADAPNDGTLYGRQSAGWSTIPGGTPASANPLMDGAVAVGTSVKFAREDHRHPTDTTRLGDTPPDGVLYARKNPGGWTTIPPSGISDAPADGIQYGRQLSGASMAWTAVAGGAAAYVPIYDTRNAAIAATIPSGATYIRINGYSTAGDEGAFDAVEIANSGTLQAWQFQSNAGSRRWQIANPYINVKMLGAVGNGTNNDNAAIQAAIDFVGTPRIHIGATTPVSGGTVYFPTGKYNVTALTVPYQGVFLQGAGTNATILLPQGTNNTLFTFSFTGSPSTPHMGQGISKMSIEYAARQTGGACFDFETVQGAWVKDIIIIGAYIGFFMNNGVVGSFTDIEIWDLSSSIGTGIYIADAQGGGDRFYRNLLITTSNPQAQWPAYGIRLQRSGGDWFDNCEINKFVNAAIQIDPPASTSVSFCWFTNCDVDTNAGYGVAIIPAAGGTVQGIYFIGCWCSSNTLSGVYIGGAGTVTGARFEAMKCVNNQQHGFNVTQSGSGAISGVDISNSVIGSNGWPSPGTYSGIVFTGVISDFSVTNSRSMGAVDGLAGGQNIGIYVGPGASNNYRIIGNDVRGNAGPGISDNASGTTKYIANNIGYNPRSFGVPVGASPFTYINNYGASQTVTIAGGAVSAIVMNGQLIGTATNTSVCVPQGMAITVTYSSAPAMDAFGA